MGEAPTSWPAAHCSAPTVRRGLLIPIAPAMPPAATSPAQIRTASWKARTDSALGAKVSPTSSEATTTPTTETPINPAAPDCVVDGRGDAGVVLVGVGEHGGG